MRGRRSPSDEKYQAIPRPPVDVKLVHELAATHRVAVAVGSRPAQLPQRLLGRDLFFWLDRTGLMRMPSTSRLARRIRVRGDIVIGTRTNALRRSGVEFRTRLTDLTDHTARFADGTAAAVDAVVWATGYRSDYGWLDVPGVVVDGGVRHEAGIPMSAACTSSACRGRPTGAPGCSASSRGTRQRSPTASTPRRTNGGTAQLPAWPVHDERSVPVLPAGDGERPKERAC